MTKVVVVVSVYEVFATKIKNKIEKKQILVTILLQLLIV